MIETSDFKLRSIFANHALEWANLKVKYRHRGITRRGCDCGGLIIGIAKEMNLLAKYEVRHYPVDWNLHAGACDIIITELEKIADEIPKSQTAKGDIIVMTFGKCISHAGIFIDNNLFVHNTLGDCCRIGRLKQSKWSKRWKKTYRLNENKMRQYT